MRVVVGIVSREGYLDWRQGGKEAGRQGLEPGRKCLSGLAREALGAMKDDFKGAVLIPIRILYSGVFVEVTGNSNRIVAIRRQTWRWRAAATNFTADEIRWFGYSPDGKTIGVVRNQSESDVVLLRESGTTTQ